MSRSRERIGVDIDSQYVRIAEVYLPKYDLPILKNFFFLERFSYSPEALREAISKKIKNRAGKGNSVVANILVPSVQVVSLELPLMSRKELAEVLPQQVRKFTPLSSEIITIIDYNIQAREKAKQEILAVAVKQIELETHLSFLKTLDLSPDVLTVNPIALLNLIQRNSELIKKSVGVLEIRREGLCLSVIDRGILYFSRWLYTNTHMESDILSFSVQIKHYFDYYKRTFPNSPSGGKIDVLLLAGEKGEKDVKRGLEEEIGVKVETLSALDYVHLHPSFSSEVNLRWLEPYLAVPLGLALEVKDKERINLLPAKVARKYKPETALLEDVLSLGKWLILILSLILLGVSFFSGLSLRVYNSRLKKTENKLVKVKPYLQLYPQMKKTQKDFNSKMELLKEMEKDIFPLDEIITEIGASLPSSMYLEKIYFRKEKRRGGGFSFSRRGRREMRGSGYLLSLEGKIFGTYKSAQSDLRKFCAVLRNIDLLSEVSFAIKGEKEIEVFKKKEGRFEINARIGRRERE